MVENKFYTRIGRNIIHLSTIRVTRNKLLAGKKGISETDLQQPRTRKRTITRQKGDDKMPRFSVELNEGDYNKFSEMATLSTFNDKANMFRQMIHTSWPFYLAVKESHPLEPGKKIMGDWLGEAYNPASIREKDQAFADQLNIRYSDKLEAIENDRRLLAKEQQELDTKARHWEWELYKCDECEYKEKYQEFMEEQAQREAQERFNRNVREVSVWPAWVYDINYKLVFAVLLFGCLILGLIILSKSVLQAYYH